MSEGWSESRGKVRSENMSKAPRKSCSNKRPAWNYDGKWLDRANALAEHVDMFPVSLYLEIVRRSLIVYVGMSLTPSYRSPAEYTDTGGKTACKTNDAW